MNTSIVLVSAGNFQEYILTNIQQLAFLGHKNIYVITNKEYYCNFWQVADKIKFIDVSELQDSYKYIEKSRLDTTMWNGFWTLTSARFFYIYAWMKRDGIENVLHIENDVLLYYNADGIFPTMDKIYLPFDSMTRSIASVMYIPNAWVLGAVLDRYDYSQNDMYNFKHMDLVENLPIFPLSKDNESIEFVTRNADKFNVIFDAAAMGQYLGGVDPRNSDQSTIGFVNETCVIKYDKCVFLTQNDRPFLFVNGTKIPIFNLHIHCKNLKKFRIKH